MQIHDETAVEVPTWVGMVNRSHDRSRDTPGGSSRDSTVSSTSHDSNEFSSAVSGDQNSPLGNLISDGGKGGVAKTSPLPKKKGLGRLSLKQKPTGSIQSLTQGSPTNHRRFTLRGSSAKFRSRGSDDSISRCPPMEGSQVSLESQTSEDEGVGGGGVRSEDGDVYEVDLVTRHVTLHRDCHLFDTPRPTAAVRGCREERGSSVNRTSSSQLQPRKRPGQSLITSNGFMELT